ncbi:hypothetical protein [uncultured Pontibacter sp.]|uniref:hypothetical protein n=1 Tax=uncultured Pontibacter sp. TaxID=453356 RepID=UPI002636DD27|nr:hypothetical protein [uncultured Pontibacter sp.]
MRDNLCEVSSFFDEYQTVDIVHDVLREALFRQDSKINKDLFNHFKEVILLQRVLRLDKGNHLTFHIPSYTDGTEIFLRDHVLLFSMLVSIYEQLKNATSTDWEEEKELSSIIDIFQEQMNFLSYSGSAEGLMIFGNEEIFADTNHFLPLFYIKEVSALKQVDKELLRTLFKPIISLGKKLGINYPILISLRSNKGLFLTGTKRPDSEYRFITTDNRTDGIFFDCINNGVEREQVQSQLKENAPATIIQLEWPYNRFDNSSYIKLLRPQDSLRLKLQRRYTLNSSSKTPKTLHFLPGELSETKDFYDHSDIGDILNIIPTGEVKTIIQLLENLKESWRELDTRVFTCPFPSKWLVLIHAGKPLEYWIKSYWDTFPTAPTSMRSELESIIEHVWRGNWIGTAIPKFQEKALNKINILLPRGNNYRSITEEFKTYLDRQLSRTEVNCIDLQDLLHGKVDGIVWILNTSWNILFNLPKREDLELLITVPDFHYLQSLLYIKVKILKETRDNILGERNKAPGVRQKLLSKEQIDDLDSLYLSEVKKAMKEAKDNAQNYRIEVSEEVDDTILEKLQDPVDDRLDQEELDTHEREERFYSKRERESHYNFNAPAVEADERYLVKISTIRSVVSLKIDTSIIIRHEGELINAVAGDLEVGDRFATYAQVRSSFELSDGILKSWAKHPEIINEWKQRLVSLHPQAHITYQMVEALLSDDDDKMVQMQTFITQWLSPDSDMILPRSKSHWNAVCKLLGVDTRHKNLAWISVRCAQRRQDNAWRRAKSRIIEAMIEERDLGRTKEQNTLDKITSYLDEELGEFLKSENIEATELTQALLDDLEHALLNDEVEFETTLKIEYTTALKETLCQDI